MWFNSFDFAIFFTAVLILYWLLQRWHRGGLRSQNTMLLVASYFFYGYWDWRFLSLIFASTLVDFIAGIKIQRAIDVRGDEGKSSQRVWIIISLVKSLGLLGFFKYYNFFANSLTNALNPIGIDASILRWDIVLPVGISFYLFQTMSYTIDVYRKQMRAVSGIKGFMDFALFVSFFPQLVAGPIERASALLPQVQSRRKFDVKQFGDGLHLIFWGLFQKVFVADNLARFIDIVFRDNADPSGFAIIAAVWAFAFQIYCDFAGYSDIARGASKCLGFELRLNFNHPYIATNPSDFWRRWHISLSTWLRDYLYIPLGGNRHGEKKTYRNLGITMLLGGLWHGAAWNFVLWGAYHGLILMVHRSVASFASRLQVKSSILLYWIWKFIRVVFMFQVVCIGWLFFRSHDFEARRIVEYLWRAFTLEGEVDVSLLIPILKFAGPLLIIEILQVAAGKAELHRVRFIPVWAKCLAYSVLFYLFAFHGAAAESFIYFQF